MGPVIGESLEILKKRALLFWDNLKSYWLTMKWYFMKTCLMTLSSTVFTRVDGVGRQREDHGRGNGNGNGKEGTKASIRDKSLYIGHPVIVGPCSR